MVVSKGKIVEKGCNARPAVLVLPLSRTTFEAVILKRWILGTHDELIEDPEGAYSQLVRLQEEAKEAQDKSLGVKHILREDQQAKVHRVGRSPSVKVKHILRGFPGPIGIYETAERSEDRIEKDPTEIEKREKVSVTRLANVNRSEVPILLIGSIAAVIVFPIFGLLLSTSINMFQKPAKELENDPKFWAILYVGLGLSSLFILPTQN